MQTAVQAQMQLLHFDRYSGELPRLGFRRATTLPSGRVVFLGEGARGDVPGLPCHWQRGPLRYELQGLWVEDNGQACLYHSATQEFWLVDRWLPNMQFDDMARRLSVDQGWDWFLPVLLDYERTRANIHGLAARLDQLRRIAYLDREGIVSWIMHVGSRLLDQFPFTWQDAVSVSDEHF